MVDTDKTEMQTSLAILRNGLQLSVVKNSRSVEDLKQDLAALTKRVEVLEKAVAAKSEAKPSPSKRKKAKSTKTKEE